VLKRLLIVCLLGMSIQAGTIFAEVPLNLIDIQGHWAEGAIEGAVEKGYVSGYEDLTFRPNQPVTRAEFMRMLVDALELPHLEKSSPWYQPYVAALVETNIHREKDFKDNYNKPLTRMEMVRLAVRATDPELQDIKTLMDDKSFMFNATKKGIIHGMGNGQLAPEGTSTRAQAVAIIERVLSLKKGSNLPTDERAITYAEVDLKGTNVESALGIDMLPLPLTWDYGSDVKVEVDKVIFVDMADKDAAYRNWFPETIRALDRKSADDMYLFAIHINFTNLKEREGYMNFDFMTEGTFVDYQKTIVLEEYYIKGITPINVVPILELETLNTVDGWYLISTPKETYEEQDIKILRLYNVRKQKQEYLTEAR
jgi:hypothetical protein